METIRYKEWNCILKFAKYHNNTVAINLIDAHDWGPVARATVNLPQIPTGYVALDTNNCGYDIVRSLANAGIIDKNPFGTLASGFCKYPLHKLTEKALCQLK